ncbi:MAG: class I SAM-dependent DNA methyltransferase, partial [Candidatus Kapaibacterium sp.]
SKMKSGGTRIGIVFNGSPLFTGAAESGESNIRKWIIENDWLEAVIALPDQLFYNTGISTYIWIITNHKSAERKGKVQLINATGAKDEELLKESTKVQTQLIASQKPSTIITENRFWQKMDRSLGNKRKKIAENGNSKGIGFITQLYGNFVENEFCKILPNEFFGYWRITVEQPLKENGKVVKSKGQPKPDASLRDYENIPFLKKSKDIINGVSYIPQTIEDYFDEEVKPHLPDAWIDHSKTKIGYEINFTKYFYEFKPLRPLADIKADILALEEKTLEMEKSVLD